VVVVSISISPKLALPLYALLLAGGANAYTCTNTVAPDITFIDSASAYGGYSDFTSGSWLEIKGSNLADPNDPRIASGTGEWAQSDFNGANAPTVLDGISATVDGKPAYIAYISPTQINIQAPQGSATGSIMVTVTNCHATSSAVVFREQSLAPGLLAPPNYSVNGKQYLVATFASDAEYVLNTSIGQSFGLLSRPAKPGDLIVAYGVGFGPVSPAIAPGVIVTSNNAVTNPVTISFGSTLANITYAGLTPEFVGLYEFYITVPQGLADGDYPIVVTQNGVQLPQPAYYLTIQSGGGATPMVQSLTLSSSSVAGGSGVTGTVTLTAPAPAGGAAVTLASNSAAAKTPSSVTVPAGGTSATFNITTSTVTSNTNATITATYGGTSASVILAVTASKSGGALPPFNLMSVTPSIGSSNQSSLTFSFDVGGAGCAASGNTLTAGDQGFTFGAVWSGYTLSGDTITCTGLETSDPSSAMTYTTGQKAQWTSATLTFTLSPQNNFSGTVASGTLTLSSSLATVNASFTGTYETE
jgi:uncharacterized protein (TIGR03437 family)